MIHIVCRARVSSCQEKHLHLLSVHSKKTSLSIEIRWRARFSKSEQTIGTYLMIIWRGTRHTLAEHLEDWPTDPVCPTSSSWHLRARPNNQLHSAICVDLSVLDPRGGGGHSLCPRLWVGSAVLTPFFRVGGIWYRSLWPFIFNPEILYMKTTDPFDPLFHQLHQQAMNRANLFDLIITAFVY